MPPGTWSATLSRIGYGELTVAWQVTPERTEFRAALPPNPLVLHELKVNVDRFARRRRSVASPVRVVSQDQLATTGSPSAYEVVVNRGVRVTGCPAGPLSFGGCVWVRGGPAQSSVVVDEVPLFGGLEDLRMYRPEELYMVEIYGGGRHVRVYTNHYMEWAAERRIRPRPVLF